MIESSTCYWVTCDACGDTNRGGEDFYMHFGSEEVAIEDAVEQEWEKIGEDHIVCVECQPMNEIQLLAIIVERKRNESEM